MSEQTLAGRALDAAVHRIITGRDTRHIKDEYGVVWKDENTWTTVPVYSLYRYPAVLDWLAGQGLYWSLERNLDGTFDCCVWDRADKATGSGELRPTPGEAVCMAVLQWKGKQ